MRVTSLGHASMLIETRQGSILCDPWFIPAFFGSWFVFPRNDQLSDDLQQRIESPDYLYISHLHADHFDEAWLVDHVTRDTTVLLPDYPTRELERRLRALGFTQFVRTRNGVETDLSDGLVIAIHAETSITDGPGGDSALVVSDGTARIVNQNDCRTSDLQALAQHGPVDLLWLQFSGAIWYPMVYRESPERLRELVDIKVNSQFQRALRYVETIAARAVVPSAGPPCFLDPELSHLNMVTGDELSIFPDQAVFMELLQTRGHHGLLAIPGTTIEVGETDLKTIHPIAEHEVAAIFTNKANYLATYAADWSDWLTAHTATWLAPQPELRRRLAAWWEPLLAMAPTLCDAVGAPAVIVTGDESVVIDFPTARVRSPKPGEQFRYGFEIQRELVETVTDAKAVDWSNALFLSCRFSAWREGPFNEYLYNFFKSLSVERMRRTESEARRKLDPPVGGSDEMIPFGDFDVERFCPHRQADLSIFGELDDSCARPTLVCTLHGWRFDLESGECLASTDRSLRVRARATAPETSDAAAS